MIAFSCPDCGKSYHLKPELGSDQPYWKGLFDSMAMKGTPRSSPTSLKTNDVFVIELGHRAGFPQKAFAGSMAASGGW